jgi:transposase
MDYFAGLDVSVKETSVCIVDNEGRLVREVKVAREPEALLQVLMIPGQPFKRIGLEAGPLSQWLFSALAEAGLPVICVETRHMRAVLKAQINKTDVRLSNVIPVRRPVISASMLDLQVSFCEGQKGRPVRIGGMALVMLTKPDVA